MRKALTGKALPVVPKKQANDSATLKHGLALLQKGRHAFEAVA